MSDSGKITTLYKRLGLVLGAKYFDVIDRLKLDYIPYCVENKEFCHVQHSKNDKFGAHKVDFYHSSKITHFLVENRPMLMLKIIEDICLTNQFPGEEAVFSIIQLILTINQTKDTIYSVKYILNQCMIVLNTIFLNFPPCWHDLREYYKNIFLEPQCTNIYLTGLESDKQSFKQNIFNFILMMLEETMYENDDNDDDNNEDEDDENETDNHKNKIDHVKYKCLEENLYEIDIYNKEFGSGILNFSDWEAKEITKKSFKTLKP